VRSPSDWTAAPGPFEKPELRPQLPHEAVRGGWLMAETLARALAALQRELKEPGKG